MIFVSPHVPAKRELKDSFDFICKSSIAFVSPHVPAKRELKANDLAEVVQNISNTFHHMSLQRGN
jgi:hypothetical protein